jgi:cytidylate kinase
MPPMRSMPPRRDVQRIVEDQVGRWKVQRRKRLRDSRQDREAPAECWPVVTVSREHGSLGSAVAEEAARLLGFSFWDQELVHHIARKSGAEAALVASLDERTRGAIEDFVSKLLVGVESSIAEYVRHVGRVVRTLERHGSAVVVGRGAQFILDPCFVFRVRVVCPEDVRVARIAYLHGLSRKEAERRVREVMRERRNFIRRHYDRDIAEPKHYDLVVNTGHLTVESAATIVADAYRAKFPTAEPADAGVPEPGVDSAPFNPQV